MFINFYFIILGNFISFLYILGCAYSALSLSISTVEDLLIWATFVLFLNIFLFWKFLQNIKKYNTVGFVTYYIVFFNWSVIFSWVWYINTLTECEILAETLLGFLLWVCCFVPVVNIFFLMGVFLVLLCPEDDPYLYIFCFYFWWCAFYYFLILFGLMYLFLW